MSRLEFTLKLIRLEVTSSRVIEGAKAAASKNAKPRFSCFRVLVALLLRYMNKITLNEWAKQNGMSRRKAEYLASSGALPVTKERREFIVRRWIQVIEQSFKLSR